MKYQVHASTDLTFTPSSATLKAEGTGILSARLTGLTAATRYTVVLVAIDAAGNSTVSSPLTVTTSTLNSETIPGVVVATPTDVQVAAVAGNQVTLTADAAAPQVGQFIASTSGDGFLRQVTQVGTVSGQTVVQTQPASLNQVANTVEISSAFVLTSVPTEVAPTQAGVAVKPSSGQKGATEWQWPQTKFRLTSAPVKRNTGNAQGPLQMGVASTGSDNIDVSTKIVSKVGNWATFSGPDTVGILTGTSGAVNLNLNVTKDDSTWSLIGSGTRIPIGICKVEVISDGGAPGLVTVGSLTPTATEMVDAYSAIRQATQGITVNAAGVAARAEPYVVKLRAYIDEAGNHCADRSLFLGWKETLDIPINVAVVSTPNFPQSESKGLDFTDDFSVHNDVTFTFDPRLEAEVKLNGAKLNYTRLEAKARAALEQKLTVTATGAGAIDKSQTLITPRKFVKVYMAGTVPIVMSGEFSADLRVQGNVTGAITATEDVKFSLEDMDYGVVYENGAWSTTKNVRPTYDLKLAGNGDAQAHLTLTLVPKLSVKFYEAATGRLIVSPYLQADAGIHGQVLADVTPAGTTTDADYWLTQGQISGGVDAYLMADLTVLDFTLVKWPGTADIADYTTFKKLTLIADTPIAGLPSLTATFDATAIHPTDSRAFLIKGRAVNVANPFKGLFGGPDAFLPFANWTAPKVIALNNAGYTFVPSPAGSDPGDVWIAFTIPGTYTVRLGGNSAMGGWARQVAEVVVTVTDSNNNGIIDQWETKFGLTGSGAAIAISDPDADGLTNLQEFQHGRNPNVKDSHLPTPTYSGINCGSPVAGQLMTCTVSGTNLPIDLALTASGCANIQLVAATASATQRQFTCTPASQGSLQVSVWSVNVGAGANYAQSIIIGQPTCTLPQVLNQAGVCAAPAATGKLNDTGITASQCYQAGSDTLVACGSAGAIALNNAQDGMTGRDADPASNGNTDGKLGFSFSSVTGGCVQDNVTGLMWEVKTADGGLRDMNKTYTNLGDNSAGDASAYVTAVNDTNLCGHNDWRLPTADELQSIVDYGVAYPGPTIDATWFPNTQGNAFWSASPFVGSSLSAWVVVFYNGSVYNYYRGNAYYVRLVRAGQ
jgi:hypothetical protein